MRVDFYRLVQGTEQIDETRSAAAIERIPSAGFEVPYEQAKAQINARHAQLVASNPNLAPLIVITSTLGDYGEGGVIIASELIHCSPVHIRERQGKPQRELVWVTDFSTGIV